MIITKCRVISRQTLLRDYFRKSSHFTVNERLLEKGGREVNFLLWLCQVLNCNVLYFGYAEKI